MIISEVLDAINIINSITIESEIDKKQEELIDEYKKKGLKFSGHIDRKKIFIDRDYTGLE